MLEPSTPVVQHGMQESAPILSLYAGESSVKPESLDTGGQLYPGISGGKPPPASLDLHSDQHDNNRLSFWIMDIRAAYKDAWFIILANVAYQ
jgi:hypothetical protein